jgi:hypothetical protein
VQATVRAVVIGVGNERRGDDAAGLSVVRALSPLLPPGVEVAETHGEAEALVEAWEGADLAVVVDTASSGLPPGRSTSRRSPCPCSGRGQGGPGTASASPQRSRSAGRSDGFRRAWSSSPSRAVRSASGSP